MIKDYVRVGLSLLCVILGLCFFTNGCSVASDKDGSLSSVRFELNNPSFRDTLESLNPDRISPEQAIRHYPTVSTLEVIGGKVTMGTGVLWLILAVLLSQCSGQHSFSWVAFDPPAGP